jgi:hypothetical protein
MELVIVARRSSVLRGTLAAARRSFGLPAPATLLSCVVFLVLGSTGRGSAQTNQASVYELNAAYLFNFAKFIEWPAGTFSDPSAPLVFAVAGEDPFGSILDRTLKGKKIGSRPIVIKRFKRVSDIEPCHILFVSSSLASKLPQVLEKLKGAPTVTVGESEGFARKGGVFRFLLMDNKVRFEINVDATRRLGLAVSAKLLQVAIVVGDE